MRRLIVLLVAVGCMGKPSEQARPDAAPQVAPARSVAAEEPKAQQPKVAEPNAEEPKAQDVPEVRLPPRVVSPAVRDRLMRGKGVPGTRALAPADRLELKRAIEEKMSLKRLRSGDDRTRLDPAERGSLDEELEKAPPGNGP